MSAIETASIVSSRSSNVGRPGGGRPVVSINDDVNQLTTFGNPFDDDEHEDTSYAYVSSLISKVKNTFTAAPASSSSTNVPSATPAPTATPTISMEEARTSPVATRRGSSAKSSVSFASVSRPAPTATTKPKQKQATFLLNPSNPAPPLVSAVPAISEVPSFPGDNQSDGGSVRGGRSPAPFHHALQSEGTEGSTFGHFIPGFQINDDARSIRTAASGRKSASASQVIRRLRGEGLSREYWMDDETAKECYDCNSIFTTWRRKHHCRICGQIFCSRCASNIIKASRFGAEGVLRVCNLCLQKLEEESDDEDDRRSVLSVSTNFPSHQLDTVRGRHSHSPFSATQLYSRSSEPRNLYSIGELKRHGSFDGFDSASQPGSPADPNGPETPWDDGGGQVVHPPFRRGLDDDERDDAAQHPLESFISASPSGASPRVPPPILSSPVAFPTQSLVGPSTIEFPGSPGSSDGGQSPLPLRSRFNSYATEYDPGDPFQRTRVHSRLEVVDLNNDNWRTRRESSAYAAELNAVSMFHLRIMLRQMIAKENVPHPKEWEETLTKLALKVASHLNLNPRTSGSMDARWSVKIKKIPGGAPRDSEYVDGAVITKNVAHKQMSRHIRQPRIMLVTFPFDYHRVEGQFMSIDPILAQEREYLKNLASRVAAHHPHVLLVEGPVSRLALEALLEKKIAVARSVKHSAIEFVSRITQSDIISSMDRLALEPRMGDCARFRIQTFEHALIPGRRKTFMRFEGCSREKGCTLILRGGDMETLSKIKKITSFIVFIVRNLKMETYLWKDSVLTMPPVSGEAAPIPRPRVLSTASVFTLSGSGGANYGGLPAQRPSTFVTPTQSRIASSSTIVTVKQTGEEDEESGDEEDEEVQRIRLSERIQTSIQPYYNTFISASATLRFPPPYPIRKMKELDDALDKAKREWQEAEAHFLLKEEEAHARQLPATSSALDLSGMHGTLGNAVDLGTPCGDGSASPERPLLEGLPPVGGASTLLQFDTDSLLARTPGALTSPSSVLSDSGPSYFDRDRSLTSESSMISSIASSMAFDGRQPTSAPLNLKDNECIAKESEYQSVKFEHQEMQRLWEWYLRKNADDFIVEKYQKISVLHSKIPSVDLELCPPCHPPVLEYMDYYGENDKTLGQAVEEYCRRAFENKACDTKGCKGNEMQHSDVYTHNDIRLLISMEPWRSGLMGDKEQYPAPNPDFITTWSVCRICGKSAPVIPMTEEACRYSFAKLLELHFYPADVRLLRGAGCLHNVYLHHMRYFALNKMVIRFQTDPVHVYEITFPPMRTRVRPEVLLELKNRDYQHMLVRNDEYWSSVAARVRQWQSYVGGSADLAAQERGAPPLGTAVVELQNHLASDCAEITELIHKTYAESAPTDTLAVGRIRIHIQVKVIRWDNDFDRMEKTYFSYPKYLATERELRKLTGHNLKRVYDFINGGPSSISEAEDKGPYAMSTSTQLPPPLSSASENEAATDADRPSEKSETDSKPLAQVFEGIPMVDSMKSDAESDSTIGVKNSKEDLQAPVPARPAETNEQTVQEMVDAPAEENPLSKQPAVVASRLPRRTRPHPSVADLVKQFQDGDQSQDAPNSTSPPDGMVSESEQEIEVPRRLNKVKGGTAHRRPLGASDRISAHITRPGSPNRRHSASALSRIPVPVAPGPSDALESDAVRRKTSISRAGFASPRRRDRSLDPVGRRSPMPKAIKGKAPANRVVSRDRPHSRTPAPTVNVKGNSRKLAVAPPGSRVSNIAKQFERLSRDNEKANRRYAMMKGKRARPLATAKAKVEIFDNIMDAARDDSEEEDSEASSEADDEDEGEDVAKRVAQSPKTKPSEDLPSAPPEPLPLPIIIPDINASPHPDDAYDLNSPTVMKSPGIRDPAKSLIPPGDGTVEPTPSRPISPVTDLNGTVGRLASSYQSGHSESEYSVGGTGGGTSMINTLVGYSGLQHWMRDATPSFGHLKYPAAPSEHLFEEAAVIVREDEPTSIIAFTLQSRDYKGALTRSKANVKLSEKSEAFPTDTDGSISDSQSWGIISVDGQSDAVNEIKEPPTVTHPVFHFESAGVQISCTVFHAEQFDALRRSCHCEQSMIESLARCLKWDATGGKSGSAFLKTRDNRFIAKELSRSELDAMSKFAPKYFEYMSNAISANRPTLLAKIFGFYKIVYKNPMLGRTVRMTLLVMENLFYDRGFCQVYDLKGSSRNRLVVPTPSKPNQVLLDENLLQNLHKSPFYIREHAKRNLRSALWNDSLFLEELNVMDYSLLVAVDDNTSEIVIGMIDYIRTYTWDKKLESWVKESTFLGGPGKGEPTIVTPKQYRTRFLNAMERYFFLIPDRWMKQAYTTEEEGKADW